MALDVDNQNQDIHGFDMCTRPKYLKKCDYCLVFSLDGSGHSNGCIAYGTKANFVTDIYVKSPLPILKMRLENPHDALYVLQKSSGVFEKFQPNAILHAHEVCTVFNIQKVLEKLVITYSANAIHRFSVVLAYRMEGVWRLRFRVVTSKDGVLVFPLFSTFQHNANVYSVPPEYDTNTVLILGVDANQNESKIMMRIYANENGNVNQDNFNGREEVITFNKFLDKGIIPNTLKPTRYGNSLRFDQRLYQSLNFEPSVGELCPNCLVTGNEHNTNNGNAVAINDVQSFRTDIYARMALYSLEIVVDPQYLVRVYNKLSGAYEEIAPNSILLADKVNGFFRIENNVIEFEATTLKRFDIVITYSAGGDFLPKYRLMVSHDNGIVCHAIDTLPPSVVLVIGIVGNPSVGIDFLGYSYENGFSYKVAFVNGSAFADIGNFSVFV